MRLVGMAVSAVGVCAVAAITMAPEPAHARCYTFQESHNGTDLFNPDGGAKATATSKLMESIETWRRNKGINKVRIGKVKIRCNPWNLNLILPHHRCYARARVCR